jgi:hypothetical protein
MDIKEMKEIPEPITPRFRSGPRKGQVKLWVRTIIEDVKKMDTQELMLMIFEGELIPDWYMEGLHEHQFEQSYMWRELWNRVKG